MPNISRKPSPDQAQPLIAVIKKGLEEKNVSLRTAAKEMKISPAHLSLILKGEEIPDAGVCNAIADFLGIPRVQVYGLAGWLEFKEQDDAALMKTISTVAENPDQAQELRWIYYSIGDPKARQSFLSWLQGCQNKNPMINQSSDSNE